MTMETMAGVVAGPIERMSLTNLSLHETLEMQFNPSELKSHVSVQYARHMPHGGTSQVMHYSGTGNRVWPELELHWIGHTRAEVGRIDSARLFLEAICYPERAARGRQRIPPEILFLWPNYIATVVRITSHSEIVNRFSVTGQPTGFVVRVTLEETLDARMSMEDVRIGGYERQGIAGDFIYDDG